MPGAKECPMCGAAMRLKRSDTEVRVPGQGRSTPQQTVEWICPECDYFEEADTEDR